MEFCQNCNTHPCSCQAIVDNCSSLFSNCLPQKPVDLFGSPFNCPKQKKTPKFASPNSRLPKNELDRLQACIDIANDILRSLGSEPDPENRRQLQLYFMELKGISIKAEIACISRKQEEDFVQAQLQEINQLGDQKELAGEAMQVKVIEKLGKVATAGRDFIQINPVGSAIFIFYSHLISIKRDACDVPERQPEFLDADRQTRRELAFNFGEYVKKNPDFVNLFFGIPLSKKLKEFIGKDIQVRINKAVLSGTLIRSEEENILIQCRNEEIEVDLREVCFVEIVNLK